MPRRALLPSRRAVLRGTLAALAASTSGACTRNPFLPEPPPPVPPDVVAADRAAERERRLLAAYDAALLLAPQLAERLLPLRGDHAVHLAALGLPEAPLQPEPTDGPPGEPEPPGELNGQPAPQAPRTAAPPLPQEPAALLAALAELERRAALAHGGAAVRSGRGVGAVLASLAACEASHVVALQ